MGRLTTTLTTAWLALLVSSAPLRAAPPSPVERGVKLRTQGKLNQAAQILARGLDVSPADRALGLELAVTLSWMGRLEAALDTYQHVLKRHPKDDAARIGAGRMLVWMGKDTAAETHYRAVLKRDPAHAEARLGMARAALLRLDDAEARRWLGGVEHSEVAALHRELDGLWRWRATVRGGLLLGLDGSYGPDVSAGLGYRVSRTLTLNAGYRFGGLDPVAEGLGLTDTASHRVDLGLVAQPDADWWVHGGVTATANALGGWIVQLPLGAATRLSEKWSLSWTVSPGLLLNPDGAVDQWSIVGRLGLAWGHQPLPGGLDIFAAVDGDGGASVVAVGRLTLPLPGSWNANLGPMGGIDLSRDDGAFGGAHLALSVNIGAMTRVTLNGEMTAGARERASISLGLEQRW